MEGTGFLGEHDEEVYRIERDDLYLVGTSEVALAGMHAKEVLDLSAGPKRYAGWSSCFRREAGSYGKDTRGIIRVHWFDKVEMFSFCRPEEAQAEHLRLLQWEEEFLQALELPYRVVDIAAGDLGTSATRKYDIEAWFPSQGTYRELTSTSDCTTFQARRLTIRYRDADGKPQTAATLNGTLCAIARTIACLLEVHQRSDGSVHVPVALRPWLGGVETLTPGMTLAAPVPRPHEGWPAEGAQGLRRPARCRSCDRPRRPDRPRHVAAEARRHRPRRHPAQRRRRGQPAAPARR